MHKKVTVPLMIATLVLSVFALTQTTQYASAITATATPSSNIPGQTSNYTVKFNISTPVLSVKDITITASAGYDVSDAKIVKLDGFSPRTTLSPAPTTTTITIHQPSATIFRSIQTKTIEFTGILNPTTETGNTWTIKVFNKFGMEVETVVAPVVLKNIQTLGRTGGTGSASESSAAAAEDLVLASLKVTGAATLGSISTSTITMTGATPSIVLSDVPATLTIGDAADTVKVLGTFQVGASVIIDGATKTISTDAGALTIDPAAAASGISIAVGGAISDIDGNLVLDDTTDIGSTATGIRVTAAGVISDIDEDTVTIDDKLKVGSSITIDGGTDTISSSGATVTVDDALSVTGLSTLTGGFSSGASSSVTAGGLSVTGGTMTDTLTVGGLTPISSIAVITGVAVTGMGVMQGPFFDPNVLPTSVIVVSFDEVAGTPLPPGTSCTATVPFVSVFFLQCADAAGAGLAGTEIFNYMVVN